MTIETAGRLMEQRRETVGHVNKVGYHVNKIIKKKKKKKKKMERCKERIKHTVPTVPMALQELFLSCRDAFKGHGTVPSPCDVQQLCCILGG